LKIIFMGTPEFALNSLKNLDEKYGVDAIFTKVDKPNQRGKKIKYNPVKQYGLDKEIPVYQPNSVKKQETLDIIKEINPDLIVVVAYGKILPQELIDIPKYGIINVHSSLLPKYRGAAPIHAAVVNGDKETGVTIMDIVEKLDAGDMIVQAKTPIHEEDTLATVHDRWADIGATALLEAVEKIFDGSAVRTPQDETKVTFVKPIKKEECEIDWTMTTDKVYNFIRGLNPFPGAYSYSNEKLFKIYFGEKIKKEYSGECGEVVEIIKGKGPVVKVANGGILLTSVKPQNKRLLSGVDLINGKMINLGDKFSIGTVKINF